MKVANVARFAADLRWEDMPNAVQQRLRVALIDTLGCMIGGIATPAARAAAGAAGGQDHTMKACALGVAASALDYDDGHYEAGGIHLGSVIVPPLLASLPSDTSLVALFEAMAAAYEIAIRAGYLMAPRHAGDPYRTSGAAASIGAAAGVARLVLGRDADGIARALRIASAQAPMATLQVPMVKESIGWGAASALGAARLASAGFAATAEPDADFLGIPPTPFTGRGGEDAFILDLGNRWRVLDVYVKPFPCCRAIHTTIDGVTAILADEGLRPADIEQLDVWVPAGVQALDFLPPASIDHAQFSFPWVLGCLIVRGAVTPWDFTEDALQDVAIIAAARRVRLHADPDLAQLSSAHSYPARIAITVGGVTRERLIQHARGSAALPLTAQQIVRKFMGMAAPVLGSEPASTLLALLESAPERLDLGALTTILAPITEFPA